MTKVSVKEARANLRALIDLAASGEEVVLLRRGKEVARLVPSARGDRRLPSLRELRASIRVKGRPMSEGVIRSRREARY